MAAPDPAARQLAAQLRADMDAAAAQAAKAGALAQSARDNSSLLGDIADRAALEWARSRGGARHVNTPVAASVPGGSAR